MTYKEEIKDLFSLTNDYYYFVQCISADFDMGKGIAVLFNQNFDTKNHLISKYDSYTSIWDNTIKKGFCIKDGKTLNLVTKRNYWLKPTYDTLQNSLNKLKNIVIAYDIHKLAMPQIGCGLDELSWEVVSSMIRKTFEDLSIEILVCKL